MKRVLVFFVCMAALAGLGSQWYLTGAAYEGAEPLRRPPSERVAGEVSANGVVEGARPEVKLRPEVAGALAIVHVHEGQQVARGTLLAELRNEAQKQRVLLARAERDKARAALEKLRNGERREKRQAVAAQEKAKKTRYLNAEADFRRTHRAGVGRAVSQQEWDADYYTVQRSKAEWEEAKSELDLIEAPPRTEDLANAEAELAAAEARYGLAQSELAKTRVLAPGPGRIMHIYAEPGEMAGPDSSQPILIMADLSVRRVRAFVEELDAVRIRPGQKASVTVDGLPGKEFRGAVSTVFPRMGKRAPHSDAPGEYKDVHFREVLIDLDAADELPLNLRVSTRIRTVADNVASANN
jgi:multidrug resistance efflux pump